MRLRVQHGADVTVPEVFRDEYGMLNIIDYCATPFRIDPRNEASEGQQLEFRTVYDGVIELTDWKCTQEHQGMP